MGTPDFAVYSLNALADAGHDVLLVVSQPDKPKGRGHKLAPTPVKECALNLSYEVFQPENLKSDEAYTYLKSFDADLFVVVAYGQILSERVLDLPKLGCINVHASLLPEYRGAAPIQWSIINGENKTGITTMFMNKGLDTGDMILKKELEINESDTGETLHDKLAVLGAQTLIETIKLFEDNCVVRVEQDNSLSSYAPMITKETAKINFDCSNVQIYNLVRAMNSYPYAQTMYQGKLMKIISCKLLEKEFTGENGEIKDVSSEGIIVKCGNGAIIINEIQIEGKKKMLVSEYIKGNLISVGEILG